MHSLNACLRLTHYLENNQAFPSTEDLAPHLLAERLEHKVSLEAIEEEGEIALGCRCPALINQLFLGRAGNPKRTFVFERKGTNNKLKAQCFAMPAGRSSSIGTGWASRRMISSSSLNLSLRLLELPLQELSPELGGTI